MRADNAWFQRKSAVLTNASQYQQNTLLPILISHNAQQGFKAYGRQQPRGSDSRLP